MTAALRRGAVRVLAMRDSRRQSLPLATHLVGASRRAVKLWFLLVGGYVAGISLAHLWLTFLPSYSEGMMLPAFW